MNNKRIIIASSNQNKVEEIKFLLGYDNVVSLKDIDFLEEIEEYGVSFYQNSLIKAEVIASIYKDDIVIADDSGLVIRSLDNKPEIFSARFAREGASDDENMNLVLNMMDGIKNRDAYFITVGCLIIPKMEPMFFSGKIEGFILGQKQGKDVFGYNQIFSINNKDSFSEIGFNKRQELSHRAICLKKIKEVLDNV